MFRVTSDDIPTLGFIAVPQIKMPKKKFENIPDFDLDGEMDDNVAYLYNEVSFMPQKLKYEQ